jgi:hypothetical protein
MEAHTQRIREQTLKEVLDSLEKLHESYLIQNVSPNDPPVVKTSFHSRETTLIEVRGAIEALSDT